ncbi:MAG: glycosyltransferase family 2 protein [Thermoanaerobaculia bacterium]
MARTPVSALITTFNEIDQIEECIRSVEWADEVYLLDSFSTDGTVELVREKFPGVVIEQHEYFGAASQKNFAIDHAQHDWILFVDADERVTPPLRKEVERLLEKGPDLWGYSIRRENFILGKPVRHSGLQRDRVTRFFHRRHARYPNRRVHADLDVDGTIGRLNGTFLHNYIRSFDHMIEKMTRYGMWGATQQFIHGKKSGFLDIFGHAFARFFRDYVINLGFLDGVPGLITVGMHTYYAFWKYAKLWEFNQLKKLGRPVPLPSLDQDEDRWVRPWEREKLDGE